jgi:hypothetical protein
VSAVPVRELELDLDAFEGPFDLLLSLVLLVASLSFFYWWQFRRDETRPPRPPKPKRQPERKPRPVKKGPNMAVPRGRVR